MQFVFLRLHSSIFDFEASRLNVQPFILISSYCMFYYLFNHGEFISFSFVGMNYHLQQFTQSVHLISNHSAD